MLTPAPPLPLFTFGDLLSQSFLEQMLERSVDSTAARLLDFVTRQLAVAEQPVLVPADGESVEGFLYRDLTEADYKRLDFYQGVDEGLYDRVVARVRADGEEHAEGTYIYLPTEKLLTRNTYNRPTP